jgi:hypothetical protein
MTFFDRIRNDTLIPHRSFLRGRDGVATMLGACVVVVDSVVSTMTGAMVPIKGPAVGVVKRREQSLA